MNIFLLSAGLVSLAVVGGHFTVGRTRYLQPMVSASFDAVARRVMLCAFHYVSVNLVLMTLVLLAAGVGIDLGGSGPLLIGFVAVHYGLYAVVQLIYAATSGIERSWLKMFQWVFFIVIAVLAGLAVL